MKHKTNAQNKIHVLTFSLNLDEYASNSYYQHNPQLFVELKSLIDSHAISSAGKILDVPRNQHLIQDMVDLTQNLPTGRSISERLYWILHDMHDFPFCQNPDCINGHMKLDDVKYFKGFAKGYQRHCCNRCAQLDPATTQVKKDTTLLKHGNPNYRNPEKTRATYSKKYGVDHPMKSSEYKKQLVQHNLQKYGYEWRVQTDEHKKLSAQTIQRHYGKDITNVFQAKEVKDQLKQIWMNNYGVDNPSKDPTIKARKLASIKKTSIEKYGVEWPIQDPCVFAKTKRKYAYDNMQFDSFPEIAYYIWLKDNSIRFEYQPKIVFKYIYDDLEHFYHPDFLLLDANQIIEIKSSSSFVDGKMICLYDRSLDGLYEAKHQCMLENDVKIMLEDEYASYVKYVEDKFGKNFKKDCRKNKDM